MKSAPSPQPPPILPAARGVCRLRTAGVASPTQNAPAASSPPLSSAPIDLLVEFGPCSGAPGGELHTPPRRDIRILASGFPTQIDAHPAARGAVPIDLTHAVLMPGMVNAHTHLDLTHLGPLDHDPDTGFVTWVDRVRGGRAQTPEAIRASVERGIELSLRAGVVIVGDIAGAPAGVPTLEPLHALAGSALAGVSFLEFFAIGSREAAALDRLDATLARAARDGLTEPREPTPGEAPRTRLGLQPHAPNTVSLSAYHRAVELAYRYSLPLATHLAETPEEQEFIAHASGPQRQMLERFGIWNDAILEHVGNGRTPIQHLRGVFHDASRRAIPCVAAHVNDTTPHVGDALAILKSSRTSVAYCPRASTYFNAAADFGPHRYRDMLAAGINVCLGTDSIINLPRGTNAPDGPGMSILDEARLLFSRDNTDPQALLGMMTVNGCRALGWDASVCSLAPGAQPLGLVAVDVQDVPSVRQTPAEQVLRSRAHARLLAIGTDRPGSA